jgi:hypothetical protein
MRITRQYKLGDTAFKVESGDHNMRDAFREVAFWDEFIRDHNKCGKCGSANVSLFNRAPKGNEYFGMHCNDCGAEKNIGQHKNAPTFFCKKDEPWTKWTPGDQHSGGQDQGGQYGNAGYGQGANAQPPIQNYNQQPPNYTPPPSGGYAPPQNNAGQGYTPPPSGGYAPPPANQTAGNPYGNPPK